MGAFRGRGGDRTMIALALIATAVSVALAAPFVPEAARRLMLSFVGVALPRRAALFSGALGGCVGGVATGPVGILIGGAAGAMWPWVRHRRRAEQRQRDIVRRFPDFLELLALALSAGATLEIALATAVEAERAGPLQKDMRRLLEEIRQGRSCAVAIAAEAERCSDLRHAAVFRFLSESAQSGHDAAAWIAAEAEAQRDRWFLSLESRSRTAGLRLLVPTVLLLFPTTFLLLLAPLLSPLQNGRISVLKRGCY